MNNKGFAISAFIYSALIIFSILLITLLSVLDVKKTSTNEINEIILEELNEVVMYSAFPKINIQNNLKAIIGDLEFDARDYITSVTDPQDVFISISEVDIDYSAVDFTRAGEYEIILSVEDSDGNETVITRILTVGHAWEVMDFVPSNTISSAYGIESFLTVSDNYFSTSVDNGENWIQHAATFIPNDVYKSLGGTVAVGNDRKIAVSTNFGFDWTVSEILYTTDPALEFDYNSVMGDINNIFWFAVGTNGVIAKGTNGDNFAVTSVVTGNPNLKDICYGDDTWVIVGDEIILYSTDNGTNWTTINATGKYYNKVVYYNNRWVIGGDGIISSTTDVTTWDDYLIGDYLINDIYYDANLWVAVGTNGLITTSDTTFVWESNLTEYTNNSVYYYEGEWFVLSEEGFVSISKNGNTWSSEKITSDSGETVLGLNSFAYGNDTLIITSDSNYIIKLQPSDYTSQFDRKTIAMGLDHTAIVKENGKVWTWGCNDHGQLGDGTTTNFYLPRELDSISDVVSIDAGYYFTVALKDDGTVWTWGNNSNGQLGLGDYNPRENPTKIEGLEGITQISVGQVDQFVFALKNDGTVYSWGCNTSGQLGQGSTGNNFNTPTLVSNLSNIKQIEAGAYETLVLSYDGTMWGAGKNSTYELGLNSNNIKDTFEHNTYVGSIVEISLTEHHAAAANITGDFYVWGSNNYYGLGLGVTGDYIIKKVPTYNDKIVSVVGIELGGARNMVETENGDIYFWGNVTSFSSALCGDETTYYSSLSPVKIALTNIEEFEQGLTNYAVIYKDNEENFYTWGKNYYLNMGLDVDDLMVFYNAKLINTMHKTTQLVDADSNTIILKDDKYFCSAGYNYYSEVGFVSANNLYPVTFFAEMEKRSGYFDSIKEIKTARYYTMLIDDDGFIWSWGEGNAYYQLGVFGDRMIPTKITNFPSVAKTIELGQNYQTLIIDENNDLWGIGYAYHGELATGSGRNLTFWVKSPYLSGVETASAGGHHSLFALNDGTFWSVGLNTSGQLGVGDTSVHGFPVQITTLSNVKQLLAANNTSFAVKNDGTLWAWGSNAEYAYGESVASYYNEPTQITTISDVVKIASDGQHTLALKGDGTVWVAGKPDNGCLGLGNVVSPVANFTQISSLEGIIDIMAGNYNSFALAADGTLYAWGQNTYGQLGLGDAYYRNVPTIVY